MTLALTDWLIIAGYLILSLIIGLMFRKRAGKNLAEFFLGGRKFPWYIAGVSMVATTFAADTPLAVTELVANSGISGNWLWWNMLAGGMLTTFFFARLWRRANVLTELEFIELRYSGKGAAVLRGFKALYLGLFMNALIIGWVNLALMSIIEVFFGITGSALLWYTAGAMLVAAAYSTLSGLWGVAITDFIQFIIAMTGTVILAVIVVNSEEVGGIDGLKDKLPEDALKFFPEIGEPGAGKALSIGLGTFLAYITVQWWASWYPGNEPGGGGYVAQRMMSAKNEQHSLYATLFFQIAHYCIRPWPWILVALCTLVLYPGLSAGDEKLGYVMAMKQFLPTGLKGLLLVAFLAAYMSTISTQLNWGASFLVNDLYKRFLMKSQQGDAENKYVLAGRISTLLLMVIALWVTSMISSISEVWKFIIECGAGLGLVLILRWYWWRINAWSEISATIAPFVAYAVSRFGFGLEFPDSFFITTGFTTLTWLAVTFLTKPTDEKHLLQFYERVKPEGAWLPLEKKLQISTDKTKLLHLLGCWISSITMVYAVLFFSGKFIFKEWKMALVWAVVALFSYFLLRFFMRSAGIMNNK